MKVSYTFSKVHKSKSNSSTRTRMAYDSLLKNIERNKATQNKKRKKKKKKTSKNKQLSNINEEIPGYKRLKQIETYHDFTLSTQELNQKPFFFVTEGFQETFPDFFKDVTDPKEIMSINKFKVIDEVEGCYYEGENGVPAFILAPRQFSLTNSKNNMKKEEFALHSLLNNLIDKNRGESRQAVCEKYVILDRLFYEANMDLDSLM